MTGITRGQLVGGRTTESWTRWDAARARRRLGLTPDGRVAGDAICAAPSILHGLSVGEGLYLELSSKC